MALASLAVVGGGSVAVSFLAQLIDELSLTSNSSKVSCILLFEPAENPGAGDAYANDLNTNLLNIPVRNMSAYAEHKAHFADWLKNASTATLEAFQVKHWDDDSFLPRPLFGRYLEDVYRNVLKIANGLGITIRHVRATVNDIHPTSGASEQVERQVCPGVRDGMQGAHRSDSRRYREDVQRRRPPESTEADDAGTCSEVPSPSGWRLSAQGQEFLARFVVLCNGNMPSASFPGLHGLPNYFRSPYPVQRLVESIGQNDPVAVIGTSLSAVDAVVALKEAGHRAPLIAVSRNGRLPSVRSIKNRRQLPARLNEAQIKALAMASGGKLTLEQVANLLLEQLRSLGEEVDMRDILGAEGSAAEQLDQEIIASSTHERLWQVVASATNEVVEVIWNLLDDAERTRFRRDWRSLWMARRATFPMQNAVKLQRYLRVGNFDIRSGFQSCAYDARTGGYQLHLRSGNQSETLNVRHVVDATSFSLDVSSTEDPLIRQLLNSGLARADPQGGMALDYATGCLLDAQGRAQDTISLLGSLAVGTYFWTLSMDVNARLALGQAKRLAKALSGTPEETSCLVDAAN